MAWKQLRPSALCTICKSMYIGALISIATAISMGTMYMMVTYLSFKTLHVCQYYPVNSTSIEIRWVRSMTAIISCIFLYIWFFAILLLVFRPFQLMEIKRTLLMICFLTYSAIFSGYNLSCFPPSSWHLSLQTFKCTKTSS